MLLTYRHGLRVSELVDLRLRDLDLDVAARLHVGGAKGAFPPFNRLKATS